MAAPTSPAAPTSAGETTARPAQGRQPAETVVEPAADADDTRPSRSTDGGDDDIEAVVVTEDDGDDDDDAVVVDDDDDDDDDVVAEPVTPVAAPRPSRPSPGRPPSAKEEPDPPFYVGERIRLIQNTRPRTGAPIGDYPVGAEGRVETVLSQTCILRFDQAPDIKEVVAFVCVESIDDEAIARRAERDRLKAAEQA